MANEGKDSFEHFESLISTWLEGARLREIGRVLEVIGAELRRRS